MSTISDIAKRAGVSKSTASLALNGDERVRPQTRRRVLDAAQALNYHPLRAARSLSSGRTWSIHLLNPTAGASLSHGFFFRFTRGVHDVARTQNYTVSLSVLDDETEAQSVLERLVLERWTDGIILLNTVDNEVLLPRLIKLDFPHVLVGRSARTGEGVFSVDNNNIEVAFDATRHLLEHDLTPIACLNGPAYHTFTQDRAQGYRKALEQAGLAFRTELMCFTTGSAHSASTAIDNLLAAGLSFRSVLAISDVLALGAMRALRRHGLLVPEDVALVGMDNDDLTEYTEPRLSSVDLHAQELGRQAASLLMQQIHGSAGNEFRHIVPHHLVIRESSG